MMDERRHDFFCSEFFGAVGGRGFLTERTSLTDLTDQFSIFSLTDITGRHLVTEKRLAE
jgi:hypothetical protein